VNITYYFLCLYVFDELIKFILILKNHII